MGIEIAKSGRVSTTFKIPQLIDSGKDVGTTHSGQITDNPATHRSIITTYTQSIHLGTELHQKRNGEASVENASGVSDRIKISGRTIDRRDNFEDVTSPQRGISIAKELLRKIHKSGFTLPERPTYLALGAGKAQGEQAFAETLGIDLSHMTLVDKGFSHLTREGLNESGFTGQIVEEDIDSYLNTLGIPKTDIVTVFGMEYVLSTPIEVAQLASLLPNALEPNGIVVIFPNLVKGDLSPVLTPQGFHSLQSPIVEPDDYHTLLMYQYSQ